MERDPVEIDLLEHDKRMQEAEDEGENGPRKREDIEPEEPEPIDQFEDGR